jgi:hypothetical protein
MNQQNFSTFRFCWIPVWKVWFFVYTFTSTIAQQSCANNIALVLCFTFWSMFEVSLITQAICSCRRSLTINAVCRTLMKVSWVWLTDKPRASCKACIVKHSRIANNKRLNLLHCPYSILIHLQVTLRSLRITLHVLKSRKQFTSRIKVFLRCNQNFDTLIWSFGIGLYAGELIRTFRVAPLHSDTLFRSRIRLLYIRRNYF